MLFIKQIIGLLVIVQHQDDLNIYQWRMIKLITLNPLKC